MECVTGKKFFVAGDDGAVRRMILDRGHAVVFKIDSADCFVFPGDTTDVHPFLYGEKQLNWTKSDFTHDRRLTSVFKHLPWDAPKIGICKGGQLLNVLSGGRLWQHVDGHMTGHQVKFKWSANAREEFFSVPSDHHQAMIPSELAEVYAWAKESSTKHGEHQTKNIDWQTRMNSYDDVEMCYYWHTSSLCIQSHPEYDGHEQFRARFWELVDELFWKKKEVQ